MTKQSMQKILVNLVGGLLAGAFTFYVLNLIPFYPQSFIFYLALAIGILWLINPILGEVSALGLFIIPITYTSLTLTLILLMFYMIIAVFETWAIGPYGFLVQAATIFILLHPELHFLILAIPLLAGLMGPRQGVFLGAFSCFLTLVLGLMIGEGNIGLLNIGSGSTPLIRLNPEPSGKLFGSGWLIAQTKNGLVDNDLFNAVLSPFGDHPVMVAQIVLWALAACLIGYFISKPIIKKVPAYASAMVIGVIVLIAEITILPKIFQEIAWDMDRSWLAIMVPFALVGAASPGLIRVAQIMTPAKKISSGTVEKELQDGSGLEGFGKKQNEIKEIVDAQFTRQNQKKGNQNESQKSRGILIFGPPGTGKSKLVRSIANEAKATLITVNRNDLNSKYYDVFVSYSTRDKVAADACVDILEKNGIRCWFAPRDIKPLADWGKEVTNAINLSKVVLLIFSSNSNRSQRVLDEINYAVSQEMIILPFRIENAPLNDALSLHLSSRHWLDGFDPSWKEYLDDMLSLVSNKLERDDKQKESTGTHEEVDLNKYVQQVFTEAQANRPSVLFFEELYDFINKEGQENDINTVDIFLECMDQLENTQGVLVMAATQYPEKIDAVVLESNRLGKLFYLPPPDRSTCRKILEKYLSDKPLAINVDLVKLTPLMDGYTLADMEAIAAEAADLAESTRDTKQKPIGTIDLEKVIKSRKPTYSPDLLAKYETFAIQYGCLAGKEKGTEEKNKLFSWMEKGKQ